MRKQALTVFAIGLGLLWAAAPVRGDTIEQVEKTLVEKSKKIKSATANFRNEADMTAQGAKTKALTEGKFEMLRDKDGKALTRMEMKNTMTMDVAGKPQKMETTTLTITDGEYAYSYTEIAGQKQAFKTKATDNWNENPFEPLRQTYDLKLLPDEKLDGAEAYVIEGKPKKGAADAPAGKALFYFRKDNGFLVKTVTFDESDKPTSTTMYTDLKLDVELKADRFVFKAPDGVQVMDMSKMTMPGGAKADKAKGDAPKADKPKKGGSDNSKKDDSEKPKKPDKPKP